MQADARADVRRARRLLSLLQPRGEMPGGGGRERAARVPAGAHGHHLPAAQGQVRVPGPVHAVRQRHVPAVGDAVRRVAGRAVAQLQRGQVQPGRVRPRHARAAHPVAALLRGRQVQERPHAALDAAAVARRPGRPVRGRPGVRPLLLRAAVRPHGRRRRGRVRPAVVDGRQGLPAAGHAQLHDTHNVHRSQDEQHHGLRLPARLLRADAAHPVRAGQDVRRSNSRAQRHLCHGQYRIALLSFSLVVVTVKLTSSMLFTGGHLAQYPTARTSSHLVFGLAAVRLSKSHTRLSSHRWCVDYGR